MGLRPAQIVRILLGLTLGITVCLAADEIFKTGTKGGWKQHDSKRPKAPVVEPVSGRESVSAPKDAVLLFDGKSLDRWQAANGGPAKWKVADGAFEVVPGSGGIETMEQFGDVHLHVEWASPSPANGKGQDRGNSGIFLMGLYEIQVLDSYRAESYADGQAGAIYGQYPPLANATRAPGEWQTYEIAFKRERFDASGKSIAPAMATVFHNGILVQNNEEILGATSWLHWTADEGRKSKGPIKLQDHGHKVRFRNIWLRDLPERPSPTGHEHDEKPIVLSSEALDKFVGDYVQNARNSRDKWAIRKAENHLTVKSPYGPALYRLDPIGPETFVMPDTDAKIVFSTNKSDGEVQAAELEVGGEGRRLSKLKP